MMDTTPQWIYGKWEYLEFLFRHDRGIEIEIQDGEKYLIGDLNKNGGTCSCCSAMDSDTIIVAYRDWSPILEGW